MTRTVHTVYNVCVCDFVYYYLILLCFVSERFKQSTPEECILVQQYLLFS